MIKSKYFDIHELVPEELYHTIHEDVLWRMVPQKLIETIDTIKNKFPNGSMSINDYEWSGNRRWSGLRTVGSPYYSFTSQHALMNAIDAVYSKYSVDEVRDYILDNPDEFPHIGGVELNVEWLHIDCRSRKDGEIITFTV